METPRWYPTTEDVLAIHDDIVSEYDDTGPGIMHRGDVDFALESIRRQGDSTSIHE